VKRILALHLVIFFCSFIAFNLTAAAESKAPKIEAPPKQVPIKQSQTEIVGEQTTEIGSTERLQSIYPSNWGQAGIFRIRSAESLPQGTLTFGIGGAFYSVSNAPFLGGSSSAKTISENLFVGYAPTDRLTLSIMRRSSSTTFGSPQSLVSSLGDFNFSAMYSFPISATIAIAPIVDILVASNFNNLAPAGSTFSLGGGLAFTINPFAQPLFFHINLIYHIPQIRSTGPAGVTTQNFFTFSRFHTLTLGLGAELKLGDFIPFLEFHQTAQFSSPVNYGTSPSKISIGTRITPLSNKSLSLILGGDIGLGQGIAAGVPFTPDYQIIGQLSYTVGLSQTERKHYYTTKDVNIVDRKFMIGKKINFELNSAKLTKDSEVLLDEIADVIKKNNVKNLLIVGHTDSTHTEQYNLKLSRERANAVRTYLYAQNVSKGTLVAQGMGKRKPIASNLTEPGRAKNRRVDFFILQ